MRKPHAWTGFAEKQHLEFRKGEISYYISFTKVFYHIMHSVLAEASQKFPEAFGKNRTDTIIEAIYKIAPIEVGNFTDFLQNEQLGYLFAFDKGVLLPKILRIDLFRKIDVRKDGG